MGVPRLLGVPPRLVRASLAVTAAVGLAGLGGLTGLSSAQAAPSDAIRGSQEWVLNAVDAPAAWEQSEGAGVTVAVLDSGVNPDVSDLAGSVITGPDLTGLHTPPSNPDWGVHGTWMASIIAGHGHDGGNDGIIGVAPEAKILSIRVIPEKNDPGYRRYDSESEQRVQQSLAAGIRDAVKDGAQVISMSLGYTTPSAVMRSAVEYAFTHGVVLVASSGNSGKNDSSGASSSSSGSAAGSSAAGGSGADAAHGAGFAPDSFPAEYPGVLSVAALQQDGAVASFSSNNLSVRVAAPGDNVPAQGRDGQYWLVSGTSPACALVAGVAALIKSRYHGLSPVDVVQAITSTARNNPPGSYNPQSGFGEVDAAAALRKAAVLAATKSARSQVASSVRFGGGPSAVPAEPVPARGSGSLVLSSIIAFVSLLVAVGAGARLAAARRAARASRAAGAGGGLNGTGGSGGAHAAYFGPAAGYRPPTGYGAPPAGYGPPAEYERPAGYEQARGGDRYAEGYRYGDDTGGHG